MQKGFTFQDRTKRSTDHVESAETNKASSGG